MLTGDRCDKKRLFAINVVDVDFWLAEGGRFFTRKQSINVHSKCVRTSTWIELFWLQGRELPGFHHCKLRRQVPDGFSARCIYLRDLRVLTLSMRTVLLTTLSGQVFILVRWVVVSVAVRYKWTPQPLLWNSLNCCPHSQLLLLSTLIFRSDAHIQIYLHWMPEVAVTFTCYRSVID